MLGRIALVTMLLLAGVVVLVGFLFGVPGWLALKHEKVKLAEYQNLEGIAGYIPAFIEQRYKRERLRAALGYLRPVEFENNLKPTVRVRLPSPP